MKCLQCGHNITKKQAFCSACGAAAPEVPPKKPFPFKLVLCIALGISLVANIILLCLPKESSQIEERGFLSPEAAITAYAEAFRDGDVDGMIATFAIAPYVDCYDLEAYITQAGYYDFYNADVGLPNDSEYKKQLNDYTRLAWIVRQIKCGYFTLTGVDNSKTLQTFPSRGAEDDIGGFMQQLRDPTFDKKLSQMKIGNVLTKDDFSIDESYSNALESYSYLNVDELCDVAIEIEFDGEQYYLFMLTAKIDGRWYNISSVSPLGLLNGIASTSGGLMKQ